MKKSIFIGMFLGLLPVMAIAQEVKTDTIRTGLQAEFIEAIGEILPIWWWLETVHQTGFLVFPAVSTRWQRKPIGFMIILWRAAVS